MARAKLSAMAAGILFCRKIYPWMESKISAGTNCLQFPQVTGGNLPAPAGNLGESFIVRGNFQTQGRFLLSSSKHFDESNHLLPLTSMVNPSNLILLQRSWTVLVGSSNSFPKKLLNGSVFTTIKMIGNWLLSLFRTFHSCRVKQRCPAKLGVGLE